MNMLGGRPEAHGMRGFMKEERSHVKAIFLEVVGSLKCANKGQFGLKFLLCRTV